MVRMQPRVITGSFTSRTFLPAIRWVGRLFGRITPASSIENLAKKLLIAGNPLSLGAREFYGIGMASTLLGVYLAFLVIQRGTDMLNVVLRILTLILFYYFPKAWLQGRVSNRQNKVRRGLPDALDMLSVCATAGLGFDQSLQRVSEYWDTPIGHEFGRVINEMEMGLTRRDALRNLSDRLEIREIASFVALILQTEQLGMSISDTLHSQAEQMRIERRFEDPGAGTESPNQNAHPDGNLNLPCAACSHPWSCHTKLNGCIQNPLIMDASPCVWSKVFWRAMSAIKTESLMHSPSFHEAMGHFRVGRWIEGF